MSENHITVRQMDFIEFMIANPLKTYMQLCQEYDSATTHMRLGANNQSFKSILQKDLKRSGKITS